MIFSVGLTVAVILGADGETVAVAAGTTDGWTVALGCAVRVAATIVPACCSIAGTCVDDDEGKLHAASNKAAAVIKAIAEDFIGSPGLRGVDVRRIL